MTRESNIPLFLWVATAVLAHLIWGGGAERAARLIEERLDIKRFALDVQKHVRLNRKPIEVTMLDESKPEADKPAESDRDKDEPPEEEKEPEDEKEQSSKDDSKKEDSSKLDDTELMKQELTIEKKKPEPKKEEPKPAEPIAEPKVDPKRRIAVRQHVKDEKQADNPNAEFIADQANKVAEQSQARITSTDQNDPDPTPGGAHAGPTGNPGNADETKIAQSEDRPGEADQAPNEGSTTSGERRSAAETPKSAGDPRIRAQAEPEPNAKQGPGAPNGAPKDLPDSKATAQKGQQPRAAVKGADAMPDTLHAEQGGWAIPKQQEAVQAQRARRAKKKRLPPPRRARSATDLLGLGAPGTTQNGITLNLTPKAALAAVGRDKLTKELRADSERRRSTHRGSWKATIGIERWRAAIENYVPSVKPGNQTALNTARVPFASYLNTIHNRLHPIFADSFLASLDSLPGDHAMNRADISTNLEIVLDKEDGRIVRMGVTKTSGVTAFDIAALESVHRAQPFGPPPGEIVSPDGNVYFHWEFWRNPYYACSTYFARPYLLKVKPKSAPPPEQPPPPPSRPSDPSEDPGRDQRHGLWLMPRSERYAARH